MIIDTMMSETLMIITMMIDTMMIDMMMIVTMMIDYADKYRFEHHVSPIKKDKGDRLLVCTCD